MNIAGVDLVDDFGGRIAQHAFGADVEDLDDAFCVRGNNREIGTGENCVLQGPRLEQRLLSLLACRVVGANQQIADDGVLRIAERRDGHHGREPASILAEVGQLVDVLDATRRLEHQGVEAGRDWCAEFATQRLGARDYLLRIGDVGRRDLVNHFGGRIAQHAFGADIEQLNDTFFVGGDNREIGTVEDRLLQGPRFQQNLLVPGVGDAIRRSSAGVDIGCGCGFSGHNPE